jgi:hypothetical protein
MLHAREIGITSIYLSARGACSPPAARDALAVQPRPGAAVGGELVRLLHHAAPRAALLRDRERDRAGRQLADGGRIGRPRLLLGARVRALRVRGLALRALGQPGTGPEALKTGARMASPERTGGDARAAGRGKSTKQDPNAIFRVPSKTVCIPSMSVRLLTLAWAPADCRAACGLAQPLVGRRSGR